MKNELRNSTLVLALRVAVELQVRFPCRIHFLLDHTGTHSCEIGIHPPPQPRLQPGYPSQAEDDLPVSMRAIRRGYFPAVHWEHPISIQISDQRFRVRVTVLFGLRAKLVPALRVSRTSPKCYNFSGFVVILCSNSIFLTV